MAKPLCAEKFCFIDVCDEHAIVVNNKLWINHPIADPNYCRPAEYTSVGAYIIGDVRVVQSAHDWKDFTEPGMGIELLYTTKKNGHITSHITKVLCDEQILVILIDSQSNSTVVIVDRVTDKQIIFKSDVEQVYGILNDVYYGCLMYYQLKDYKRHSVGKLDFVAKTVHLYSFAFTEATVEWRQTPNWHTEHVEVLISKSQYCDLIYELYFTKCRIRLVAYQYCWGDKEAQRLQIVLFDTTHPGLTFTHFVVNREINKVYIKTTDNTYTLSFLSMIYSWVLQHQFSENLLLNWDIKLFVGKENHVLNTEILSVRCPTLINLS